MGNQRYLFAQVLELIEVQFIIVVRIEKLESLERGHVDNIQGDLNGRLDYNGRWGKVDVVGDLVDVLHGGAPEGKLHLPLGQEPVPIFVDGLESGLSLENEISVF